MSAINKAFPFIGAGGGGIVGVLGGSVLFTALGFALLGPVGGAIGLGIGAIGGGTGGIIAGAKCGQAIKKSTEGIDDNK